MTSTNLKESDYLTSWAIFFVIASVGGMLAGLIVGGIAGGILGVLGVSKSLIATVGGSLGFLVSLPISYFSFRFAVRKFLLPKLPAPAEAPVQFQQAA